MKKLERNSLSWDVLGNGVLNPDYDEGTMEDFPVVKYKFPVDIGNKSTMGQQSLSIFHLNCQGLSSSFNFLTELCKFSELDVLALNETWLRNHTMSLLEIDSYDCVTQNRESRLHGGLALYCRKNITMKIRNDLRVNKEMVFESMVVELCKSGKFFFVVVVYRPPSGNVQEFNDLLERQMDKLSGLNRPCFVCGDFNLDLFSVNVNPRVRDFLNVMLGYGLRPTVNICSRVTLRSESLLDNIFVNVKYDFADVILNDVSDHFGVLVVIREFGVPTAMNIPPQISALKMDAEALNIFRRKLKNTQFDFLESSDLQVNEKFSLWYSEITKLLKESCTVIKKPAFHVTPRKPWVTRGLMKAISNRRLLYKYSVVSPEAKVRYKKYNCELNNLLREARINYYRNEFKKSAGNPRRTWRVIHSVLSPSKSSILPENFNTDASIVDNMCDHFSIVGKRIANSTRKFSEDGTYHQFLPEESDVSAYLKPVTASELRTTLWNMRNNASGADFLSLRVLKYVFSEICDQVCVLFNMCLKVGVFPDFMKIARVVPLFKGGEKNLPNDYRPISLLPVLSRVFEKLISGRMVDFLENKKYFSKTQFGFRKAMSTDQALLFLTTFVNDALDQGWKVASVFLDIVKAFDAVDHGILLVKLRNCGFRGMFYRLLESFLQDRKQFVSAGEIKSQVKSVEFGVPQGSVLGPLLFLIYIDDLRNAINGLSFDLKCRDTGASKSILPYFADDTHLTVAAKTGEMLIQNLQTGMLNIEKWMRVNRLQLNHAKSHFVMYGRSSNYYPWIDKIQFGENILPREVSTKYLGVIVDECLNFKEHISCVSGKVARNVGMMRKLKHFFPKDIMRLLYFSFVHPYLLYGCLVWSSTFLIHLRPLRSLQNNALRVLTGDNHNMSVRHRYNQVNILPMAGLFRFYNALFMFKYTHALLPECFREMFTSGVNFHNYSTRTSTLVRRPQVITKRSVFSIRHVGPRVWEPLTQAISTIDELNEFRSKLKGQCLSTYEF